MPDLRTNVAGRSLSRYGQGIGRVPDRSAPGMVPPPASKGTGQSEAVERLTSLVVGEVERSGAPAGLGLSPRKNLAEGLDPSRWVCHDVSMTTTATTIPVELRAELNELFEGVCSENEGRIETDPAELLDTDEDGLIARFGEDLGDHLARLTFHADIECVQTCCVAFDCPGGWINVGPVWVTFNGSEIGEGDFREDVITWSGRSQF